METFLHKSTGMIYLQRYENVWLNRFVMQLHGPSHVQISSAFSSSSSSVNHRPAIEGHANDEVTEQEQRDIERALRLSVQDAHRRGSSRDESSIPSAPSLSMLSDEMSPRATVAPDGVEIVQQIGLAAIPSAPAASTNPNGAQEQDECVICFDGPQEAVCVPCGHNAICMDCANELLDTTRLCPVCRQQVREVIKLYRV